MTSSQTPLQEGPSPGHCSGRWSAAGRPRAGDGAGAAAPGGGARGRASVRDIASTPRKAAISADSRLPKPERLPRLRLRRRSD